MESQNSNVKCQNYISNLKTFKDLSFKIQI